MKRLMLLIAVLTVAVLMLSACAPQQTTRTVKTETPEPAEPEAPADEPVEDDEPTEQPVDEPIDEPVDEEPEDEPAPTPAVSQEELDALAADLEGMEFDDLGGLEE